MRVIAHYNDETLPPGSIRLPLLMGQAFQKRIRLQASSSSTTMPNASTHLAGYGRVGRRWPSWLREDMVDGLETAPEAFIGLLTGATWEARIAGRRNLMRRCR